jgi:hypothetical protein
MKKNIGLAVIIMIVLVMSATIPVSAASQKTAAAVSKDTATLAVNTALQTYISATASGTDAKTALAQAQAAGAQIIAGTAASAATGTAVGTVAAASQITPSGALIYSTPEFAVYYLKTGLSKYSNFPMVSLLIDNQSAHSLSFCSNDATTSVDGVMMTDPLLVAELAPHTKSYVDFTLSGYSSKFTPDINTMRSVVLGMFYRHDNGWDFSYLICNPIILR